MKRSFVAKKPQIVTKSDITEMVLEEQQILPFQRKDEFNRTVMRLVVENKLSYIDSILEVCEIFEIEPDAVGGMISEPIKSKVEEEACNLHLMNRGAARLPGM